MRSQLRGFLINWIVCSVFSAGLLAGCGGGGDVGSEVAVVENFAIAYVKRPVPGEDDDPPDVRDVSAFQAGADLYLRDLAAPGVAERNITVVETDGLGDVKDISPSYDGSRLLLALRKPEIEGADPEDQPTWNIWEYDLVENRLRRIIESDIIAEAGQDMAPAYLPDGRIVFSSTRQRQSRAILLDENKPQFEALDEDLDQPAAVLHVMNDDGSDIRQISFNQSHDLDPSMLDSGEVVFSRWNHMGNRNEISLYKVRPDGTELQPLYGGQSHATGSGGATVQFLQPVARPDGRLLSLIRPFTGIDGGGGNLVVIDAENYLDHDQPISATLPGIVAGSGQIPVITGAEVRTDDSASPGGRFNVGWPLWDGTSRVLASWSLCRLLEDEVIVTCSEERLAAADVSEAPPLYGIYIFDPVDGTRRPVVPPQEDVMFSEIVALQSRSLPEVLPDQAAGTGLDPALIEERSGVLHIRSVYDFDGMFNGLGSGADGIAELADPAQTTADQRPARFLRVVKAVSIPGDEVLDLPPTAFGASGRQRMREIVGYAPIEPDGSVKIKVPADVSLAVSIVDRDGRRIGARHQYWLQVRPGETRSCNGCHTPANGAGHGHGAGPPAVHSGSQSTGQPYPNTDPALFTDFGETMAETRTRLDPAALTPATGLVYEDVWTDQAAAGRPPDAAFALRYADLATPVPVDDQCQAAWDSLCRIVINYEQHIHPIWSRDRGADTCTSCHGTEDAMSNLQVPEAQLDLSDGPSDQQAAHFKSYRELLFGDFEQAIIDDLLQDRLEQVTDGNGDPVFELDADGNMVPVLDTVPVSPSMSAAGAAASGRFFNLFEAGASHDGRLDPIELKLIAEWLDIGAQYYNDPFAAPPP